MDKKNQTSNKFNFKKITETLQFFLVAFFFQLSHNINYDLKLSGKKEHLTSVSLQR